MLYTLVVLAGVFNYIQAAPLSSCLRQADCIDSTITELDDLDDDGNVQYEICLVFDATLEDCVKEDEISHACVAGVDGFVTEEDGEKLEGLSSGSGLCDTVPCGVYTTFGLKDGPSCELDGPSLYANLSIPDYDYELICYSGLSCSANTKNKNSKACKWAIRAPDCPDEDTSTATPIDTTQADETGTTQADEVGTTTTDERCVCRQSDSSLDGYEAAVDADECVLRCDGECESVGDGMCVMPRDPNPAYAATYNRERMNVNDLVTVDDDSDTNGDGNTNNDSDTPSDTDSDTPTNIEGLSNKGGIIGVSMVGLLAMVGLYLW